jgi:hypothetical protein
VLADADCLDAGGNSLAERVITRQIADQPEIGRERDRGHHESRVGR